MSWSKPRFLDLPQVSRSRLISGTAAVAIAAYILRRWTRNGSTSPSTQNRHRKDRTTVAVNRQFLSQLMKLLRIAFPNVLSKESFLLTAHTLTLVIRTFLSIYVARLDGRIVKSIVGRDIPDFLNLMLKWLGVAIPATFINSLIRYLESKLALSLRTRLVQHAYRLYFNNQTYYRVSNLDSRLSNPDQCLTEDLQAFSCSVAHLYSNVSKPLLDIVLMSGALFRVFAKRTNSDQRSMWPFAIAMGTVYVTGKILKAVSPQFGKLVAEDAERKGYLRYVHSRLVSNAEEVAFYGGSKVELSLLQTAYKSMTDFKEIIFQKRLLYVMLEQFFMKYVWTGAGMFMIAIPIMIGGKMTDPDLSSVSDRTQTYTMARNLMSSGADALERIMSSYKEVAEMAGYTFRVSNMFTVFEDVSSGHYRRACVVQPSLDIAPQSVKERASLEEKEVEETGSGSDSYSIISEEDNHDCESTNAKLPPTTTSPRDISSQTAHSQSQDPPLVSLEAQGVITETEGDISLVDVPIMTPNGDVLVSGITFDVHAGMHLLIAGPNGCGKSSLFRILSGLWPVFRGHLARPSRKQMFYIPQRPYMSMGTLRDQVIYPDSREEMEANGFTDNSLQEIFQIVHLQHIVNREGGWDAVNDWPDVLSGGEKQRLGMARIFYHKPQYALLDECTSAVSFDVEGVIFQAAKDRGITLMSISHRPSLWKHHSHLLQFDGQGGWRMEELDVTGRLTLRDEKEQLEERLRGLPSMQRRLREVCSLLGEDSVTVTQQ